MATGNFLKFAKQASQPCYNYDSSLYETNKYVKYMMYMYNEKICPPSDDFSHTTHDALALQNSDVPPKITG